MTILWFRLAKSWIILSNLVKNKTMPSFNTSIERRKRMKKISPEINLMRKFQYVVILAIFISLFIPGINGSADTGQNPIMKFDLQYNVDSVTMEDARLLFCEDVECNNSQEVLGPFHCDQDYCSYHYGGEGYYKLVIDYSDQTRESNIFQKTSYNVRYTVTVNQDGLQVTETESSDQTDPRNQINSFLIALAFTIPIELIVSGIFLKLKKRSFKPLIIIIVNLITLPIVWFVFPLIPIDSFLVIALGEIFALLFEAVFIHRLSRDLTFATSFWLSLWMNLASFLIPGLLSFFGYFSVY
jgi:hypothetical protein